MSRTVFRLESIYSSRRFQPVFLFVLVSLILLAYSNTFNASFQFDDQPSIMENESIRSLGNIPGLLRGQRGVTMASFAVNYAIGGLDETGYHIVNVSIHVLNAIAAYFLVLGIFKGTSGADGEPRARKLAAFSALIFALHPVQTEAVTYIVQRMESLAALFYLSAILVFRRSASASTPAKRGLLYAGTGVLYILGFYSKETVFTLPAAIFLYDLFFMSEGNIRKVFSRWPVYVILFALMVFFTVHDIVPLSGFGDMSKDSSMAAAQAASVPAKHAASDSHGGPTSVSAGFSVQGISPRDYLFTQFDVLIYYISLLFVPVNQNLDYDYPLATSLFKAPEAHKGAVLNIPMLPPVVSLAILLLILAAGAYLFRRSKSVADPGKKADGMAVSFFIFWFFLILAPTSSFIPIVDVIFEHRLYLSTLGFAVIFVVTADRLIGFVANRLRIGE